MSQKYSEREDILALKANAEKSVEYGVLLVSPTVISGLIGAIKRLEDRVEEMKGVIRELRDPDLPVW